MSLLGKTTFYLYYLIILCVFNLYASIYLYSPLATLFGTIEGRNVRQGLCRVLEVICEQDPSQGPLGQLVSSMNKWDPQRLEEPDYTHRLQTHKEINLILESGTPSFEWTALALYNSFNFVRTVSGLLLSNKISGTTKFRRPPLVSQCDRWH